MSTVKAITFVPEDTIIRVSTSSLDGWAVLVAVALLTLAALLFWHESRKLRVTNRDLANMVRAIGQSAVANAFKP